MPDTAPPLKSTLAHLRVFLVDDHAVFLEGVRNLLALENIEVVGTAGDGFEAFEKARSRRKQIGAGEQRLVSTSGHIEPGAFGTSLLSLGIANAAFRYAMQYAQERKAFGKIIGSFQILQHYLADIAIEIENARNLIYKCARLCDTGKRYDVEATMAKIVSCRASELAARYGMEIMGGYGYTME